MAWETDRDTNVNADGAGLRENPQIPSPVSEEADTGDPGGNPPTPPDHPPEEPYGSWGDWFWANNPMYLLSLLFMLTGLYLAGRASQEGASLITIVGFFGVQNLYEMIIIAMAIYLLRNHIQSRHGKILLGFILLFLGDVTLYQNRITTMASTQDVAWVSAVISGLYLLLAAAKFGFIMKSLDITPRWEQLFYPIAAFGLIYFAPQVFMSTVYNLGDLSVLKNDQYPQWLFYEICLLAALIQIPVIVGFWRKSPFDEKFPNPWLEDENLFYKGILLVPFFLVPIQIYYNILTDEKLKDIPLMINFVPYLICGLFFLQGFFRKSIEQEFGLNHFDFAASIVLLAVMGIFDTTAHLPSYVFGPAIIKINFALLIIANIAVTVTRRNFYTLSLLVTVFSYYLMAEIAAQTKKIYEYGRDLSLTTWAGVMMALSFITLGAGFALSVKSGSNQKRTGHS